MKILLTGATGFIGKALVLELIQKNFNVSIAVRQKSNLFPDEVKQFIVGNFENNPDFSASLSEVDCVIHIAGKAHVIDKVKASYLDEFRKINTELTLDLAKQAVTAGVERFVFLSSIGVNGNQNNQPFLEIDTPNPQDPYAVSKYEAEQGLLKLAKNNSLEVVIIRPPLVYGNNAPGNFGRLIQWARAKIIFPLPLGAVNNVRSLIAIDNLVSFFVKPSIYGTLAARIAKVPRRIAMLEGLGYIYTPLKNNFTFKKNILQYAHGFLASIGYAFADKVLFLNRDDPVDLAKKSFIDFKKFKVIGPIGLELSSYPYTEVVITKSIRFIFIARMLAEKGVYEYLAAARIVKLKYPDTEFVILGGLDPDNPSALSKEQLALVVSERLVIYPGHVSNVSEWLAKSHVFVLPSYREGFPRSTQEAMAMGKAIITTNVPGCRETVQDGKNGFLIPLFDVEILAEKMIYLIEHPKEIVRMGNESYNTALEKFDVNKINTALEKLIVEG